MRPGLLLTIVYGVLLALGLGLPAVVVAQRDPISWLDLVLYLVAGGALLVAALVLCLLVARLCYPLYWWMAQVQGHDVFEYDGVYFVGLRLTRVPGRVQRLVFGMDDRMRRWDLLFGLLFLVLVPVHFMGMATAHRVYDQTLPDPPKISETLHTTLLSSLPVMREWGERWRPEADLTKRIERELQLLRMQPRKTDEQRFQLAQLHLLNAFTRRDRAGDPFYTSPGEHIFFDRSQGAQAVVYLNQLLDQSELERAPWAGGALALIGFFHLSDRNYPAAEEYLTRALAEMGQGDETGISRYEVLLMAAQSAMLSGDESLAIERLEQVLVDDRMPNAAYALALEHYAEALRLMGEHGQVTELLDKAMDLYKVEEDQAGVARVHLHRAALALDRGRLQEAGRQLSTASSLASGLGDGFTLNMVQRLSQAFPG